MNASKVFQKSIACYQNALKMNGQTQNAANQELPTRQEVGSAITEVHDLIQSRPELVDSLQKPYAMPSIEVERLHKAIDEMRIGARVHEELNRQGRSVAWLARQLGKDRPNLYYFFDRNTIDAELLLRISYYLKHDFLQDVNEVCKAYGL